MIGVIGIIIIFVMVFGGYIAAGGKMGLILKALPFEMMMIGGAALGAFILSNDMGVVKHTVKDLGRVVQGTQVEAAGLPRSAVPALRTDPSGPQQSGGVWKSISRRRRNSTIFARYPKIMKDQRGGRADLRHDALGVSELRRPAPGRGGARKADGGELPPCAAFVATRSSRWPTACRRWVSSPPCSASSRPWARSTSRPRSSAR